MLIFMELFDGVVANGYFLHLFQNEGEYIFVRCDNLTEFVVKGLLLRAHLVKVECQILKWSVIL